MIRGLLPMVVMLSACGVDGAPVPPSQVGAEGPVEEEEDARRIREGSVLITGSAVAGIAVEG